MLVHVVQNIMVIQIRNRLCCFDRRLNLSTKLFSKPKISFKSPTWSAKENMAYFISIWECAVEYI